MILKKRIPNNFYKLFRTRNMDYFMAFLVAIYEQGNQEYATLGLTDNECKAIIAETITNSQIAWQIDETEEAESISIASSPASILNKLIDWGWLKSDFDERSNCYLISFPEYSQLYVELFQKLNREDDSKERESMLAVYSALYTYQTDEEKNNGMLYNALQTSKRLGQLLSNMQDGMRSYFDELSNKKNFIGIQEVLVEEINNSDSKRYAILTTTDSFYRYKEEIKELISQILMENDLQRMELEKKREESAADSGNARNERAMEQCIDAARIVSQVDREFDLIEKKYNHLIEQKTVFAKRALARIHYIIQGNNLDADNIDKLITILGRSKKSEEICAALQEKIKFSAPFKNISDNSIYIKRGKTESVFAPIAKQEVAVIEEMTDFVPKPLYTHRQLQDFKTKNMHKGVFRTTEQTVQSVEDLEKLLFLWQEETNVWKEEDTVSVHEELHSENGMTFSRLVIEL